MPRLIKIGNSFSTLSGFSEEELAIVKEQLTYTDENALFDYEKYKNLYIGYRARKNNRKAWGMKILMDQAQARMKVCLLKKDKFPSGLLEVVKDILSDLNYETCYRDLREKPERELALPWKHPNQEDRYYQSEVVKVAAAEGRGVIESAVGSGKTHMMMKIIKLLGVPSLIVEPSVDLKNQVINDLELTFGKMYVEDLTKSKKGFSGRLKPIRITNIQNLSSLAKKGMLEEALEGVKLLACDEFHHAGANSYTDLLPYFSNMYYRFGFTGTFLRNDSKTLDMWGFLSKVLYSYPAVKAIEDGFLTPITVKIHKIPGAIKNTYPREYTANYCENINLIYKIEEILDANHEKQVLILVKQKEKAGHVIFEYLQQKGFNVSYVSGDDDKKHVSKALKDFNAKKTKILIGSSIIGEGIDIRSTEHLIMAQGGKSEIAVTQALGRLVRLFEGKKMGILHDFWFEDTKYMEKHLIERLDVYKKNFGAEVEDANV